MNKNQYKTLTETLIKEVDELNAVKLSSRRVIKSCDEMNKAYLDRNRFLEEKVEELEADCKDLIYERNDFAKQLNGPDVAELRKEIRQLQDQNDELTRMCAPDPDIPERQVKTADDISQWCRKFGDCDTCNYMKIDDEGNGECDLEIYGDEPCCWSSHVIATLDRIMTFEPPTDTVVEDTEDDK